MIRPIRRILVAVKDVRGKGSRTIRKAAALARSMGASVELFHAITEPVAVEALMMSGLGVQKFEDDERRRYLRRLERIAEPLRRNGIKVTTAAEWDYPVHEAVVRRASDINADLIIAERHGTRHVAPWLLHYSDWELLRQSPVPVLVVKTSRLYEAPRVLAAIDPSHTFSKTAQLDSAILRLGARIATAMRGRLHALHTYVPTLMGLTPEELSIPDATAQIVSLSARDATKRYDKALRAARLGSLPPSCRHVVAQHAIDAIPRLARELDCSLVVMGALSRSGLKRMVIGNTAERVLDALPCDLLIVKPPGFKSRVPRRARGPMLISLGLPSGMV